MSLTSDVIIYIDDELINWLDVTAILRSTCDKGKDIWFVLLDKTEYEAEPHRRLIFSYYRNNLTEDYKNHTLSGKIHFIDSKDDFNEHC